MLTLNFGLSTDGVSVDTALSGKPNPSIGEMSYAMSASVSMGSGSHLDRVGGDRESASNAPLAGSIASASTSHKLEVAADVASNKRFSFSSGHSECASATVSFSERSTNLSNYDDSSVRGLAGSIYGHRACDRASIDHGHHPTTPVDVHVDGLETACVPETAVPIESGPVAASATGRCVSFQSSMSAPAKSRSYELLNSYCEVCHTAHRPCCPNFATNENKSPRSTTTTTAVPGTAKSVIKTKDKQTRRKASVKSTCSDTVPRAASSKSKSAKQQRPSRAPDTQPQPRTAHTLPVASTSGGQVVVVGKPKSSKNEKSRPGRSLLESIVNVFHN